PAHVVAVAQVDVGRPAHRGQAEPDRGHREAGAAEGHAHTLGHGFQRKDPPDMTAFALTGFDHAPQLRDGLPDTRLGQGEARVRVQHWSAHPVDNAVAAGYLRQMAEYRFPVVLGRDYAGVVEATSGGVTRYAPGDQVFGLVPHASPDVQRGAWAERI